MRQSFLRAIAFGTFGFFFSCAAVVASQHSRPNGAIITVTNNHDAGPGSFRQAVADAQNGDTIVFDPIVSGKIVLITGVIEINKNLTINGGGTHQFHIFGAYGAFHIMPGSEVTIMGLYGEGHGGPEQGCIWNDNAMLYLDHCGFGGSVYGPHGGGAIYNDGSKGGATLTVRNSGFSGTTNSSGGAIYNSNYGQMYLVNTSIQNGVANYNDGGAIYNDGTATLIRCQIFQNKAGDPFVSGNGSGGGIYNAGHLTITDCNIRENNAGIYGGGVANSGTLFLNSSSVISNTAHPYDNPNGANGGIFNTGVMTITNCTISRNTAYLGPGGIGNAGANAILAINNSTISDNLNGGIKNTDGATLRMGNTILNANLPANLSAPTPGTVTSLGYNMSSDDAAGFLVSPGDQVNIDPQLDSIGYYGGPTQTQGLLDGSPAINAGDPNFAGTLTYDQRGFHYSRVYNGRIDIGTFEVQPFPQPADLANISTRLRVGTGDEVGIAGFILWEGFNPIVIRGLGPSLAGQGVSDYLVDPVLELRDSSGALLAQNDNWQDDPVSAEQLIELGLAPTNDLEAALVTADLPWRSAYTAILSGNKKGTGIGLVEVYNAGQLDPANFALANISTRGVVGTNEEVMIGGFILTGQDQTRVAIRGLGPSLAQSGVTNPLLDPTLELRDVNGALILANDNWVEDSSSAEQLFIAGLELPDQLEPGMMAILGPGVYTALLAGKDGGTGVGLVEVYDAE